MSDETKTVTEREAVLRERAAYARALEEYRFMSTYGAVDIASRAFPLPKVQRPRKRIDAECVSWRVVGGAAQWSHDGHYWTPLVEQGSYHRMYLSLERVSILTDLLANPTELAEEES